MGSLLRSCSPALAAAIAGGVVLHSADAFQFNLVDGVTSYYLTTWKQDLKIGGQVYTSAIPWIKRSKWSVVNTMEVATMDVTIAAYNQSFSGGAQIKTQMHNGLFDGAQCILTRVFMINPGDTTTLGGVQLFGGDVGSIDIGGLESVLKIKSKINRLDMQTPRNFFSIPCLHGFCDAGCTLSRLTYTTSHTVGTSPAPTVFFIPWDTAPSDPTVYINGTVAFQSGPNTGARRNIAFADSTGAFVVYPLNYVPQIGDACTFFQGCDKTYNSGSNNSCTAYSNTQHYRGFEFVPPPLSAY